MNKIKKNLILAIIALVGISAYSPQAFSVLHGQDKDIFGNPFESSRIVEINFLDSSCTASVVGSRTLLTAAHCVSSSKPGVKPVLLAYVGNEIYYGSFIIFNSFLDLAVIALDKEIPGGNYLSIGGKVSRKGDVWYAGRGVYQIDPDNPRDNKSHLIDYNLRIGSGKVSHFVDPTAAVTGLLGALASGDYRMSIKDGPWINVTNMGMSDLSEDVTILVPRPYDMPVVAPGDSGGPAFARDSDGTTKIIGVNVVTDFEHNTWLSNLSYEESQKFLREAADYLKVEICGLNTDCPGPSVAR